MSQERNPVPGVRTTATGADNKGQTRGGIPGFYQRQGAPRRHRGLKYLALRPSVSPTAVQPRRFIWLPRMSQCLDSILIAGPGSQRDGGAQAVATPGVAAETDVSANGPGLPRQPDPPNGPGPGLFPVVPPRRHRLVREYDRELTSAATGGWSGCSVA